MICTVQPGQRKGKRPREWREMRLIAAQAKDSATAVYAATFGSVAETGRRWGHCARQAGWGLKRQHPRRGGRRRLDPAPEQGRCFGNKETFCATFIMSASIWARRRQRAGVTNPAPGAGHSRRDCGGAQCKRCSRRCGPHLESSGTIDEGKPLCTMATATWNNRLDCLDYPRALNLGLPIGSGMIESGHRHVLHARLKKAGTAWLTRSRRPNSALGSSQGQPPMGLPLELILTHFLITP